MSHSWTRPFTEITRADLPTVGGKGANLGEMARAGWPVPAGFCVTTAAFRQFMDDSGAAADLYAELAALAPDDVAAVRAVGAGWRACLAEKPIPAAVAAAIEAAWSDLGADQAYAVRSSATAEDLPDASFAGQQETYLNVRGRDELLGRVRDCWISLFTDRAILYRARNGFDHAEVALSVVVQQMIDPEASGILFTADPVSNSRACLTIDASYGLGEALVAGLVTPDLYRVNKRDLDDIAIQVADKQLAIRARPDGGTYQETLTGAQRTAQVLSRAQIRELTELALAVEHHYGQPQDIEWGLAEGRFFLLQARPITSLYPMLPPPADDSLHIYVSLSHAQVMTDPIRPLAVSALQLIMPFGLRPGTLELNPNVQSAGGRVYIDVTPMLRHPVSRRIIPAFLRLADPLMRQAVLQVMARDDFHRDEATAPRATSHGLAHWLGPVLRAVPGQLFWRRPENGIDEVSAIITTTVSEAKVMLAAAPAGAPRLAAAGTVLRSFFQPDKALKIPPYLGAGILADRLLQRILDGRAEAKDLTAVSRGLHGNVTTEMDLEVGDLADVARREPALAAHLKNSPDAATALASITTIPGGADFLAAWNAFLARYGMRGPSEIDISRPRWRDAPDSLLQMVVGNLGQTEPGAHRRYHAQLAAAGAAAGERLAAAARYGLLGPLRARLVARLVRVARNLIPVREHPKYLMIQLMGLARQIILECGDMLVAAGRMADRDDVWFLTWPELTAALTDDTLALTARIAERKTAHARHYTLTPPRVMTSDGEIPVVTYDTGDRPDGSLAGNPVSAGIVEGIARVVLDPTQTLLQPGEILVAPFTDPGWTPLFINAAGLVMEVGGIMTHGSVIAREYGIPAVVGVIDATKHIQTGQRLRVHGDAGYVEILPAAA